MNGSKGIEKKINQDLDRARRDIALLRDDAVIGIGRRFEQMTEKPMKSATIAAKSLNKSIGQGLTTYNAKVQDVVDRIPGNITKKAARYPWVAVTLSLVLGLMLGIILKPGRHIMV